MNAGPLNRDQIKYIAVFTMTLNHVARVFIEPDTLLYECFIYIGYFTAPVMCYFLAEGFRHTGSRARYCLRLGIFAALSELPFCMAFSEAFNGETGISYCGMNMIFTLFLCYCMIWALEDLQSTLLKILTVFVTFYLSTFSDWALIAPLFALVFQWAGTDEEKVKGAFAASVLLLGMYRFMEVYGVWSDGESLAYAIKNMIGPALAGIVIIFGYNGKRAEKGRRISKWFFYAYYPLHLAVIGGMRIWL